MEKNAFKFESDFRRSDILNRFQLRSIHFIHPLYTANNSNELCGVKTILTHSIES